MSRKEWKVSEMHLHGLFRAAQRKKQPQQTTQQTKWGMHSPGLSPLRKEILTRYDMDTPKSVTKDHTEGLCLHEVSDTKFREQENSDCRRLERRGTGAQQSSHTGTRAYHNVIYLIQTARLQQSRYNLKITAARHTGKAQLQPK